MDINKIKGTGKEKALFKIVTEYYPEYKEINDLGDLRLERLVEKALALASGGLYKYIDESHKDFSDDSDSKTTSIWLNRSYRGEISNVETAGGGRKVGALRVIVYNFVTDRLMFYYLPKSFWETFTITKHPSSNIGKIIYSYNTKKDSVSASHESFEPYRCKSFEELAKKI